MKNAGRAKQAAFRLVYWSVFYLLLLLFAGMLAQLLARFLAYLAGGLVLAWVGFGLFCFYFFRDPEARVPNSSGVIVAPAHGRVDLVEDRLVGMKSRGIYETPGGTLLYAAHSELEQLTLDRRTLALKDAIAPRYADMVYEGRWWSTEREAMDALVDATQRRVTGEVRLKLYRGTSAVVGRTSPHSLYDERFVTFGEDDVYAVCELPDDEAAAAASLARWPLRSTNPSAGRQRSVSSSEKRGGGADGEHHPRL